MEELKVKGLVLFSSDYKEKDKLVTLFTLENGKLMGALRGCKAPNAKLKFAFQPFCFAEFILSRNGNYTTITNAQLLESFFDLTNDLETYYKSSLLLEMTDIATTPEQPNPQLFLNLLTALKQICYEKANPNSIVLKFGIELLKLSGYQFNYETCFVCKLPLRDRKKSLNLENGSFVCASCAAPDAVRVSDAAFNTMRIVSNTDWDRLGSVKIADSLLEEAVSLMQSDVENRFNAKLKSILK